MEGLTSLIGNGKGVEIGVLTVLEYQHQELLLLVQVQLVQLHNPISIFSRKDHLPVVFSFAGWHADIVTV